jgi:hypothetical protein
MNRRYLTREEAAPFLKPFDENDENDVRADKFRKMTFDRGARALRERGSIVMSSIPKRLHYAQTLEFRLLF